VRGLTARRKAGLEQQIVVAMRQSALDGGRSVSLPFDPAAEMV
jgi:hypothetical protein